MYVCIYTYIYIYIHKYTYICIYTYINTYIYIHVVHTHICIYIYVYIVHTHIYIYICTHTYDMYTFLAMLLPKDQSFKTARSLPASLSPGAERERDCPQGLRVQKEIHDGGGCGSRSAGCKLRCKLMSWKMVVFNGKTIYQLWIYPIDFSKIT